MSSASPDDHERAIRALEELSSRRATLAALERHLVAEARRVGVTWREIGDSLGITTQSAHERFRVLDPTSRTRVPNPLRAEFEEIHEAVRSRLQSASPEGSDP